MEYLFTSESVSEGHPDKIADQISDAVLDQFLSIDPEARVACECLITDDYLVIAGEVAGPWLNPEDIRIKAVEVIRSLGYTGHEIGFDPDAAWCNVVMQPQSCDINISVSNGGAGDQGLMFGYACNETAELMPLPIHLAHRLVERLAAVRKDGTLPWLRPDGKSQVAVRYKDGVPVGIDNVLVSAHREWHPTKAEVREALIELVVKPVIKPYFPNENPSYIINPGGVFRLGGPAADTGLTGRKIIVDTYGGSCPHGGGAFSGKDPSKVDRSGAYMARYVAKHIVAAGLADRCTLQVAYAIGLADPTSLYLDVHGTGKAPLERILQAVKALFDLTPAGIISTLDLKRPIYQRTAAYGHFGRPGLPWEILNPDIIGELQSLVKPEAKSHV